MCVPTQKGLGAEGRGCRGRRVQREGLERVELQNLRKGGVSVKMAASSHRLIRATKKKYIPTVLMNTWGEGERDRKSVV